MRKGGNVSAKMAIERLWIAEKMSGGVWVTIAAVAYMDRALRFSAV